MRWFTVHNILRCYVRWDRDRYVAHCVDMDVCAVGDDIPSACGSLVAAINGRVDVAVGLRHKTAWGKDPRPGAPFGSGDVVRNLFLRAPLSYRLRYWFARIFCRYAI